MCHCVRGSKQDRGSYELRLWSQAPRLEFQLCHFLPLCPWAGDASSVPQFPHLQKGGNSIASEGCRENQGVSKCDVLPVCSKHSIHVTYCSLVILLRTKGEMGLGAPDSSPGVAGWLQVTQVFFSSFMESPCPLSVYATLLCSRPEVGLWSGEGVPHLSMGKRKVLWGFRAGDRESPWVGPGP